MRSSKGPRQSATHEGEDVVPQGPPPLTLTGYRKMTEIYTIWYEPDRAALGRAGAPATDPALAAPSGLGDVSPSDPAEGAFGFPPVCGGRRASRPLHFLLEMSLVRLQLHLKRKLFLHFEDLHRRPSAAPSEVLRQERCLILGYLRRKEEDVRARPAPAASPLQRVRYDFYVYAPQRRPRGRCGRHATPY